MVFCKGSIFVKVQRLKLKRSVKMFINLTNHPSDKWSESQRKAAEEYGEIVDISGHRQQDVFRRSQKICNGLCKEDYGEETKVCVMSG